MCQKILFILAHLSSKAHKVSFQYGIGPASVRPSVRACVCGCVHIKLKSMQRSGTDAIRTQLQSSNPKREITNITNSQNTKRTYGQPSEQLFPKRWPLSNRTRTKNNMNIRKVKRHRNSDTKTGNREPHQNYRLGTVSNELLGGGLN